MLITALDSLGVKKEARIVILTVCLTALATHFVDDRILLADRGAVRQLAENEIAELKLAKQKHEELLELRLRELQQQSKTLSEMRQEVSRLQTFEQVLPDWRKALNDEREKAAVMQGNLSRLNAEVNEAQQMANSCTAERNDLKTTVIKLNNIVLQHQPLLERRNEIRELENAKRLAESTLTELERESYMVAFNAPKIEQMKRITAEYHQQLIQLRQCAK